jgi:hypothetical protein
MLKFMIINTLFDRKKRMSRIFGAIFFILVLAGCAYNPFNSSSSSDQADKSDQKISDESEHFPSTRIATGRTVFIFNPNYGAWALYDENGSLVNTGRASGGKSYCPDINRSCKTVTGVFRVIGKGGSSCFSTKFPLETNGGAPMPYCMYFHQAGYAIHGSNDVPNYNASHGCVRVTPDVAEWLSSNYMKIGSTVIILPY